MKHARRWVVGATAAVLPVLAVASPAAAATATDNDAVGPFTFEASGGGSVECQFAGGHSVDSDTGELSIGWALGGASPCRGAMSIVVQYVDDHGDPSHADTIAVDSGGVQNFFIYDAGSTAVTVDYRIEFAGCAAGCVQTMQTKTK
jgi:hypothetical protein